MRGGARGARVVLGWFLSTQISVIALIRADDVRCDELRSHLQGQRVECVTVNLSAHDC